MPPKMPPKDAPKDGSFTSAELLAKVGRIIFCLVFNSAEHHPRRRRARFGALTRRDSEPHSGRRWARFGAGTRPPQARFGGGIRLHEVRSAPSSAASQKHRRSPLGASPEPLKIISDSSRSRPRKGGRNAPPALRREMECAICIFQISRGNRIHMPSWGGSSARGGRWGWGPADICAPS